MKLAIATLLALTGAARAQSPKYPPAPVDKDAEAAAKSKLWDQAVTPAKKPYADLVAAARAALEQRTPDQRIAAVQKLDEAIALVPEASEAYRVRGDAHQLQLAWAACAKDYALAERYAGDTELRPRDRTELHRALGLCQARAGQLANAERTLAEAAATGGSGELLMRLGEVRIAMGKLDEAIGALKAAIESTDMTSQVMIHWLLAAAYDRARTPAEAHAEAAIAAGFDRSYSVLVNPQLPLIGSGEAEYLLGLAYAVYEPPRPEYVQLYFRRFLALAPDSPWRKRAEEHLREVRPSELPGSVVRIGTSPLDTDAARAAIGKAMPAMRACLAKLPSISLEVAITKTAPRAPRADRSRPSFLAPPEGTSSTLLLDLESAPKDLIDAAQRCVEPIAARVALPAPKERDTYYTAKFLVVAP